MLVNYYSDVAGECVTKHYHSSSMIQVNAKSLHKFIDDLFMADDIPRSNVISMLSDSANYMRGKIGGFETLLRKDIPHLLDIDGDTCHHIHNYVRVFCKQFGQHAENLMADLFREFTYSPDLLSYLKDLCTMMHATYHKPPERIAHRWLSSYDTANVDLEMMDAFTLLYFTWIPANMKQTYKLFVNDITKGFTPVSITKYQQIQHLCQKKGMTDAGKKIKQRIVEKIFINESVHLP